MSYTREQLTELKRERQVVLGDLEDLWLTLATKLAPSLTVTRAQEYVLHGICRRLKIIRRAIDNIFAIFPAERKELLRQEELNDLEINLHAFVINIYGLQDNIAWVYLIEKHLEDAVENGRVGVGLFNKSTQDQLPEEVRAYLGSETIKSWNKQYSKNFRDALAHRIPLYIPPMTMTPTDAQRYQELENQIFEQIMKRDFERTEALREEQNAIGSVCGVFLHSYSDSDASSPILLHPQVLVDAKTVMESSAWSVRICPRPSNRVVSKSGHSEFPRRNQ